MVMEMPPALYTQYCQATFPGEDLRSTTLLDEDPVLYLCGDRKRYNFP